MEANSTFIRWAVGDIDRLFWYDQLSEAFRHMEWIQHWNINWVGNTTEYFCAAVKDDEGDIHTFSSGDVFYYLQGAWWKGDRSFEEEQMIDQEMLDTMVQMIIYKELVYGQEKNNA